MGFISWIVVGAIAGFLANQIVGSREGLLRTIVIGIVGGLVGGFVATSVLKIGSVNGINVESIVIATLGAVAILLLVHFGTGSRGRRHGLR
ncbi:MAG: GlsB/YeaQ/YmgE family stress response membrane protein [Candidatus Limnocylindrales bacterium]